MDNPAKAILGIPCSVTNARLLGEIESILQHLSDNHRQDFARLCTLVQEIAPYEGDDPLCMGIFLTAVRESVEEGGRVLIRETLTTEDLQYAVPHELGHAATTYEDLHARGQTNDEWQS